MTIFVWLPISMLLPLGGLGLISESHCSHWLKTISVSHLNDFFSFPELWYSTYNFAFEFDKLAGIQDLQLAGKISTNNACIRFSYRYTMFLSGC